MGVTNYYWDELTDNLLMETDENDEVIATYQHEPTLHGELNSMTRDGKTYYYDYDGEGNTVGVTDEDQNVVEEAAYTAFGEVVEKSSSIVNPFGYKGAQGYYTDVETGDCYARSRPYVPVTGRWLVRDPLGFLDGLNLYKYVANNPVNVVDPSGLLSQSTVSHKWNGDNKCGYYEWDTKWTPGKDEQDGYIVQLVTIKQKVTNCGGGVVPLESPCAVSKPQPSVFGTTYFEMWRVVGGVVHYDAGANPPTKPTGAFDDRFSRGSSPDTFGCHVKWGEAIFIPEKKLRSFPAPFKPGGVGNAGELFAVCSNRQIRQLWNAWRQSYRSSITEKVQERTWSCCTCPNPEPAYEHEHHEIGRSLKGSNELDSDCGK